MAGVMRLVSVLTLLASQSPSSGFNLDTQHPVILRGPEPAPGAAPDASYFGYSVGLINDSDTGAWVLAGAPRANSSLGLYDIPSTGALYKCSLEPGKCEEVILDTKGNEVTRQPPNSYRDYKQGSWIGGAMDVNPGVDGKVAVCGHRWINQLSPNSHYANGVCYWMGSDVQDYQANKVLPLVRTGMQTLRTDKQNFLYAYGQAGISVHFAKNGTELLMGAPGIYNWKGSVVRLSNTVDIGVGPNQRRRRRRQAYSLDLSVFRVPNPYLSDAVHENDYFGYSVGSGEFLGDGNTYYVAGAPRAAYGKGKVFVFDFPPNELEPIGVVLERTGVQVGEYFGASVLGVDVSGDGRPELLVGAPQHALPPAAAAADGLEHGRVCVYSNLGRGQLAERALVLTGGRANRARFGSTLASVGDLDLDGYNDIAVGAPYEEEERGAIYIYLGGASGLSATYSQRILASQLSLELRGFGVSISHGVDMDGNRYSDLAVGSYLSGQAVMLRAQPVLRFDADLRPRTDRLLPTDKQFTLSACLKYFGHHLPDPVSADIRMQIESRHVVCAFDLSGGSRDNFTYTRTLAYDSYTCDEWTVLIKSDIYDYTQPIQISMSYNLSSHDAAVAAHEHSAEPVFISTDVSKQAERQRRRRQVNGFVEGDLSEFCASCPVVNRGAPKQTHVTVSVPFSIGCGVDGVCQSDLSVSAAISGLEDGVLVIGASPTIDLDVDVTNRGEPASLPSVQVALPQPLRLVRLPRLCSEREMADRVVLTCHVRPHPLPAGADARLRLAVDVSALAPGTEHVTLTLNVSSSGEEVAALDNARDFTLQLRTEADIAITGQPIEEPPLYYDKKEDREESERNDPNYVIISHRYQVLRYLASPVDAVNVSFLVPVNVTDWQGHELRVVDLFRPKVALDGRRISCSVETGYYLAPDGESYAEAPRTWRRRYQLTPQQRSLLAPPEHHSDGNATTVLNCTQPFVSCVRVECGTVAFPRRETNLVATLTMRVKIHELEPYVGERDSLVISTVGIAEVGAVPYPLQPEGDRPDIYQVHTVLLPSSLQPFPIWVIVVAVLGALLLLAMITYGLFKAGFFKRRRPEGV